MFLQSPHIDFDLHGAANFLDMPGLHGMIRQVVLESIKREIVYPNKVTLVTADNVPIYKMFLPKPTGILKLTIVEAANLPQSDFGGLFSIDPYCVVQVISPSISSSCSSSISLPGGLHYQDNKKEHWQQSGLE